MANELFEAFNNDCKKIDTAAGLLEDLERNLKNETGKAIEELRDAVIKGTDQDVINKINQLIEIKSDWIAYRDTCSKVRETLANVTLSFLKKNG